MFDVGEEVVCIDDSPTNKLGRCDLVKGKHYFVDWIGPFQMHSGAEEIVCVRLQGVVRDLPMPLISFLRGMCTAAGADESELDAVIKHYKDAPFRATRFAPIQKKTTDISELSKPLPNRRC